MTIVLNVLAVVIAAPLLYWQPWMAVMLSNGHWKSASAEKSVRQNT